MPHDQRSYAVMLPDAVRRKALAKGNSGLRWVAALDAIVSEVAMAWGLEIDCVFERSSESLVLGVHRADGAMAVLKLGCPGVDLGREAYVYGLDNGRALPKVLAHHSKLNALLLEALGTPIADLGWSIDAQMRAVCRTAKALWQTPTEGAGLLTGRSRAHWVHRFIQEKWRSLQAPCELETRNRALDYAVERAHAHRDEESVFVHGDAHLRNTLTLLNGSEAPDAECMLIDPKGYYAEPACDVAILMRRCHEELAADPARLGRERCAWLAEHTGVDERAIWQWGFMERVASGLRIRQAGREHQNPLMLRIAHAWATEPPPL